MMKHYKFSPAPERIVNSVKLENLIDWGAGWLKLYYAHESPNDLAKRQVLTQHV